MSISIVFFNMLWEMGTLGLLNIVTFLEKNGYPAKHVYLTKSIQETSEETDEILSFIERAQPNLVGFSLMSFNFNRTKKLTVEIKRRFPETKVIGGGIHPTFDPEESMQYANFVCVGEGEESSLELVQASVEWIRSLIMKNTKLVDWTKRILFLPRTFSLHPGEGKGNCR